MILINYPKCSTCVRAKKFLQANNINFTDRNIVEDTPSKEELLEIISKSNLEPKKFFNTSGKVYKELNLKDKINFLNLEEMTELLASNGMLIKRPILITKETVIVGFKEEVYKELL